MKKFFALLLVMTMIISLGSVFSSAECNPEFSVCVDFLQTRAEPCTTQSTIFDQPIEALDANAAKNGGTVYLEDDTAKYLFFEGWYATGLEYADDTTSIGHRVDGGEIIWSSEPDAALANATGCEYNLRAYVNILIYQGTHYIEVFAKIVDEDEPVPVFDFEYESDFGEIPPATPTPEPTEVPAATPEPTEAPATDVPATDAPAEDAPKADDTAKTEKKDNSALGYILIGAGVVIIAAVVIVIIIKKKKK